MRRLWQLITLMAVIACLSGCVTWRHSSGAPLSDADKFECNQRCGFYDTRMSPVGVAFCTDSCLRSKGYYTE